MAQTYCNQCSRFRDIPTCTDDLIVGDISHNSTAVIVYLKNWTTNVIYRFTTTTSGTGLLTIDLTDSGELKVIPGHDYELWYTLESATDIDQRGTFTVDAVNYTCAGFTFTNITYMGYNMYNYNTQTLKLKS